MLCIRDNCEVFPHNDKFSWCYGFTCRSTPLHFMELVFSGITFSTFARTPEQKVLVDHMCCRRCTSFTKVLKQKMSFVDCKVS